LKLAWRGTHADADILITMTVIRSAILLALAQSAFAQAADDPALLVREAAATAQVARSWKAEGKLARSENGRDQPAVTFRIAFQLPPGGIKSPGPRSARLEIEGGDLPLTRICDGSAQRTYYPDLKGFIRVVLPQFAPCAYPLIAWPALDVSLSPPAAVGTDTITVDHHARPCEIVRAAFAASGRDAGVRESVTLCIDRESKKVLRYQLQHSSPAPAWSETYTFSSLEIDPQLPPALFDFQAPEGSHAFATIDWLTPISNLAAGVVQVSNAVNAPVLVELTPPIAPAEAALVEGGNTVALRIQIGRDGTVHAVEVSRSLGTGMDEAAVKCVKQWRFKPGESASGPVAVAGTIFVHFMDPMTK
jgi:TonB family protein